MIISLAMGLTVAWIEQVMYYIMWVYTLEVSTKLLAHVGFHKTARRFVADPFWSGMKLRPLSPSPS